MKGIKSISYLIAILCVFMLIAVAESFGQQVEEKDLSVSGKIMGKKPGQNSLQIELYDIEAFGSHRFSVPLTDNGSFSFKVDIPKALSTLSLSLKGDTQKSMQKIIERGDVLFIELNAVTKPVSAKVYSNNPIKYACEDSLKIQYESFLKNRSADKQYRQDLHQAYAIGDFRKIHHYYVQAYESFLSVIERFEGQVSPELLDYYKGKYTRAYLGIWEAILITAYQKADSDQIKKTIRKSYLDHQFKDYIIDRNNASLNSEYLRYHIERAQNSLFFRSADNRFSFRLIYEYLKNHSQAEFRERLLTFFLNSTMKYLYVINFRQEDTDTILNETYNLVKNPKLKTLLVSQPKLARGSQVFNFSLPDTAGKIISLSDFNGKVVLLDIWQEGCLGCADFFRKFEREIAPKLHSANFQKISISTDKTKKGWIRGIKSGFFTKADHLNLYTEGLGIAHPFTKYYNIQAVPFLLLIDKSGMVVAKIENSMSASEVLKLIETALN